MGSVSCKSCSTPCTEADSLPVLDEKPLQLLCMLCVDFMPVAIFHMTSVVGTLDMRSPMLNEGVTEVIGNLICRPYSLYEL